MHINRVESADTAFARRRRRVDRLLGMAASLKAGAHSICLVPDAQGGTT